MKCFKHDTCDAVAVCSYCGRAVCADCISSPLTVRVACSMNCAAGMAAQSRAIQQLIDKSTQSAKASAFYCYLTSGLSAAATAAAWYMLPSPFLICFTAACAVALFVAGVWHGRVAKKTEFTSEEIGGSPGDTKSI